jgi:hypothetical protein
MGLVVFAAFVPTSAADGVIATIDGPADVSAPAVRGARTQVNPLPPPPTYSGCLVGTVTRVSTSIDPAQRWWVGKVSDNWKASFRAEAGVLGPVVVVGDSLTLASAEETMRRLVNDGFGPICIDGGVARRVGPVTGSKVSSGVDVIARIKASDPVWQMPIVRWVLAFGTNDVGQGIPTYAPTIQRGIAAVGVSSYPIFWVDVRTRREKIDYGTVTPPNWRLMETTWNARLADAGVTIIPWAASVEPDTSTYIISLPDYVHLTPAGEDLRGLLIHQALTA